ncbi:hypothetical protein AVANS14531_03400 [Campylobacter sp. Cr9]|uniref:tetratricopeptide repeat protein n=1 Tax=unclassified Campylobacter TaxID=2593542 RepID=UPI001EFB1AC1|nr:tetratricopeptide repeat protein [Campylobacter sp. RM5004]MBZ7985382.1 hypothetical protein [Campylobacter sp. Cr9]ULO01046.1 Tol-Pal system protein YbgF [Campylobacter sp. RM5004]
MIKKIIFLGALAPIIYAETSAFNAGNINLKEPYGLTENEKVLLENKKKVETLSKDYTGVDFKTNKALERIEGIQSVIDDLNNKTYNFEGKLLEVEKFSKEKSESYDKELADIKQELKNQRYAINQLKKALSELTNLVGSLGESKAAKISNIELNTNNVTAQTPAQKMDNAISLFNSKNYDAAAKIFEELANSRHKPAQCNFYLGQIAYAKKDYNNAIYYYKTSSDLYNAQGVKAPNMPLILLNTANSLKAINELDKANNFYAALKKQFPNSSEAKSIN